MKSLEEFLRRYQGRLINEFHLRIIECHSSKTRFCIHPIGLDGMENDFWVCQNKIKPISQEKQNREQRIREWWYRLGRIARKGCGSAPKESRRICVDAIEVNPKSDLEWIILTMPSGKAVRIPSKNLIILSDEMGKTAHAVLEEEGVHYFKSESEHVCESNRIEGNKP